MSTAIGKTTPSLIGMISFFFKQVTSKAKTFPRYLYPSFGMSQSR